MSACSDTLLSGCTATHNSAEQTKVQQLKNQAVSGDTASQYQLGIYYATENQWPWEKTLGYDWFMDAAKAGDIDLLCKELVIITETDSIYKLTNRNGKYYNNKLYIHPKWRNR